MAYLAVLSASIGRRAGFAATLGVALGLLIVGLATALGLAAVITNFRLLYEALRWAGVLYLFWLAWEAWRREEDTLPDAANATRDSKYFLRGLVTNLLNPKAGIFYLAVLPTFVNELRPPLAQTVTLSAIYVVIATTIHSGVVLLADNTRPWLEDRERSVLIRRVFSLLLAVIAIWLLFATKYQTR
jgi:threonine/homoserine/homoserine lactone efflux protein